MVVLMKVFQKMQKYRRICSNLILPNVNIYMGN